MGSQTRKGENEAWFRELNERLERRAVGNSGQRGTFKIVCECAVEDCTERIEIGFASYERVREDPAAFVIVPGHADPNCERVISEEGPYQVVEKFGPAGMVAEAQDPRA